VTTLIQRMREDLVRRNCAGSTIRSYLHTLEDFRRQAAAIWSARFVTWWSAMSFDDRATER
jgi:hypothetical protein